MRTPRSVRVRRPSRSRGPSARPRRPTRRCAACAARGGSPSLGAARGSRRRRDLALLPRARHAVFRRRLPVPRAGSRPLAVGGAHRPGPAEQLLSPGAPAGLLLGRRARSANPPHAFHAVNLALFLGALVLLFALGRRLVGARAAMIATALLALHYSAEVPVRWAGGSQELLAVNGALAALCSDVTRQSRARGRRVAVAALSKEVVLVTPLIAFLIDRRAGEPWSERRSGLAARRRRRVWARRLGVRAAHAAGARAPTSSSSRGARRRVRAPAAGDRSAPRRAQRRARALPRCRCPPLVPLAARVVGGGRGRGRGGRRAGAHAHARAPRTARARTPARDRDRHRVGAGRFAAGRAVAILWSAYYYLFAMCGVARARRAGFEPSAARVGDRGAGGARVGLGQRAALDEFAPRASRGPPQSHVNRFYIERANRYVARYLGLAQRAQPDAARSAARCSSPGSRATSRSRPPTDRWCAGPIATPACAPTTSTPSRATRARRGPISSSSARRLAARDGSRRRPDARIAFSMILNDQPARAHATRSTLDLERQPADARAHYWIAWCRLALGRTARSACACARRIHTVRAARRPRPTPAARRSRGAAITRRALPRCAAPHAARARSRGARAARGLAAGREPRVIPTDAIEAFAARVLAPSDPIAWRRWAMVQLYRQRHLEALASFERYFELAGISAKSDAEAQQWVASIRRQLPGGDITKEQ